MKPDDRRNAIIAATLPLLVERGPRISTRQIAQAAGIAEGTIFRVFPDKKSLIIATVASALDPGPVIRDLTAIAPSPDLRDRVRDILTVLTHRIAANRNLLLALRDVPDHCQAEEKPAAAIMAAVHRAKVQIVAAVTGLVEADRARLRCPPATVARLLFSVVMASAGPHSEQSEPLDPAVLTELLLDGLLRPSDQNDQNDN